MSQWRARFEETSTGEAVLDWLGDFYHVLLVAGLMGFMLWNRVRTWPRFVVSGEVLFSGNDPWYHYRQIVYTVHHWPETMPFDPWTYFPHGTASGQFGTFYDQVIATFANIVGLGDPGQHTVAMVALFAPAVVGVAAAIPAYYIGRRLGGRVGGVTSVTVVALSAGSFLQRSMVGFVDHQVAEALLQPLGVLGVMVAVAVANREKPIYEQFVERDFAALRRTLGWSAIAGVAVTLYLWVWPPGVLLLGILGAYFVVQLSIEFVKGSSPEHTAIAGAVAMTVTGLTSIASLRVLEITATDSSLLQPLLAFAVAFGCVYMAWLARVWERGDRSRRQYPLAVLGTIVAVAVLMWLVTPDLFSYFVDQVLRVVGFTTSPTAGTVGEANPLRQPIKLVQGNGFGVFLALVGALGILGQQSLDDDPAPEKMLVVVWVVFLTAATFTQVRFSYYLTFPVAALTGYVVSGTVSWIDLDGDGLEFYQITALFAILLVVVAPMFLFVSPLTVGDQNGPGGGIQGWSQSLDWMDGHTPQEGHLEGNTNQLEYYGTYHATSDFDYPPGTYGVMSWWDYGHWITSYGQRIPNANPFQQGAHTAANFLLAPNETYGNQVLNSVSEPGSPTRYVMVDWKMINVYGGPQFGGKFFAPPRFSDLGNQSDYYRPVYVQSSNGITARMYYHRQAYYDSMAVRLYRYHGSAVRPQPIVFNWNIESNDRGSYPAVTQGQRNVRIFRSMAAARRFVRNDSTSQIGGIGPFPQERVPALQHYRLVGTSNLSAGASGRFINGMRVRLRGVGRRGVFFRTSPQWTKVFERVDGATIDGTGPANATVAANVTMYNPASNSTFQYRQQAHTGPEGHFQMTVPYSTTGYDNWGPENGYTNVSVRARGPYTLRAASQQNRTIYRWNATVDVPEGNVIGQGDGPITVHMQRHEYASFGNATGNATGGNATSNTTDAGTTGGNTTGSGSSGGGNTTSDGQGLIAPATSDGQGPIAPATSDGQGPIAPARRVRP
ncbi:MAG: oligosaccharyl transferase, archaeosortase A system-associated [Haloarculaceae archaeon]